MCARPSAPQYKTAAGFLWAYIPLTQDWAALRLKCREVKLQLEAIKREEHPIIDTAMPLPYLAGFIDADGTFDIQKL